LLGTSSFEIASTNKLRGEAKAKKMEAKSTNWKMKANKTERYLRNSKNNANLVL